MIKYVIGLILSQFVAFTLSARMVCLHCDKTKWLEGGVEGVDRHGYALHAECLGKVMLAHDYPLTFFAYWNSGSDNVSVYFGDGWSFPFAESRIVPLDNTRFEMHQPDGVVHRFARNPKKPSEIQSGVHRWLGNVDGRRIRVWSHPECPYGRGKDAMKMEFWDGRLVKMEFEGSIIELRYDGKMVKTIIVDGKDVFRMRKIGKNQIEIIGINCKTTATLDTVKLPDGNGKSTLGESLVSLASSDGQSRRFIYDVDKNGNGVFSSPEEKFVWDGSRRVIVSKDDWSYSVSDLNDGTGNAKIRRVDSQGHAEEHSYDRKQGFKIDEYGFGSKTVSRFFTSGALNGLMRWQEQYYNGKLEKREEYAYDSAGRSVYTRRMSAPITANNYSEIWNDEKGRIMRTRQNGDDTTTREYVYHPSGRCVAQLCNGKIVVTNVWNAAEIVDWCKNSKKSAVPPVIIEFCDASIPMLKTGRAPVISNVSGESKN